MAGITTSQTIGPFPHESWRWAFDAAAPPALTIEGSVFDGGGQPIDDAMLEAWTFAAAHSKHNQPVAAFCRAPTNARGEFSLALSTTPNDGVYVTLFARGVVKHQFTAAFLEDHETPARSALLQQVPADRRATLIARKVARDRYRWDIRVQGSAGNPETVFFDYE